MKRVMVMILALLLALGGSTVTVPNDKWYWQTFG